MIPYASSFPGPANPAYTSSPRSSSDQGGSNTHVQGNSSGCQINIPTSTAACLTEVGPGIPANPTAFRVQLPAVFNPSLGMGMPPAIPRPQPHHQYNPAMLPTMQSYAHQNFEGASSRGLSTRIGSSDGLLLLATNSMLSNGSGTGASASSGALIPPSHTFEPPKN